MPGPAQVDHSKRFACPICMRWFSREHYVKDHVAIIHEDSGRFKCAHCTKSFRTKYECQTHERLHTGERPFVCQICQARFNSKGNLKAHHLDHHAEKKFRCEVCGKLFGRKYVLRCHLQSHSNERLECGLCEKWFRRKDSLQRHQTLDHPDPHGTSRRRFVQGEDQKDHRVKVVQSNRSDSVSKTHHLRTRGKLLNYRKYEDDVEPEESSESRSSGNSESDYQDNDDESNEPDKAARSDDVLEEDDKRRIEREHDSDSETASPDEPPESSAVCSANLKVVFDVEYRAPD